MPDASVLLLSAEANVASLPRAHHLRRYLRRLADKSDHRYFTAIVDAVFDVDPALLQKPFEPPLGGQWRHVLQARRKERMSPFLQDMREVAQYRDRDWRSIFRLAGMPRRFKYNALLCSRLARAALKIVNGTGSAGLHGFFERFIEAGGGREQPLLRAALLQALPGVRLDAVIDGLGISRPPGLADVVVLGRLGIVSSVSNVADCNGQLTTPCACACEEATAFYRDVAKATGQTFEYVAAVFRASFAWSRFDKSNPGTFGAAVCFADGPKCEACAHDPYCQKRGVEALTRNRDSGWLTLYPALHDDLFNARSTLGELPRVATDAVLSCLRFERAIAQWADFRIPEPVRLKPVRAALVRLPVAALQEASTKWAEQRYPGDDLALLKRRDYPAEFWPSERLADQKLPCVLDAPHRCFFAGHGYALLEEYVRRGEAFIPLLAVDWEQVADICERDEENVVRQQPPATATLPPVP